MVKEHHKEEGLRSLDEEHHKAEVHRRAEGIHVDERDDNVQEDFYFQLAYRWCRSMMFENQGIRLHQI